MKNDTKTALLPEQLNALTEYAQLNGRSWKRELNLAWFNGQDCYARDSKGNEIGHWLRQIRNQFGPSWLVKFSFAKTSTHKGEE